MPVVDFTNVETKSFELLPRGDYLLRITGAEIRDSQSSEYQYLNLEFNVVDPAEFVDRKQWDSMSFSPAALWKLKDFLLASGYTEEDLAGEFELDPEALIGGEVYARIAQKKDARNGDEMRNVIQKYNPA